MSSNFWYQNFRSAEFTGKIMLFPGEHCERTCKIGRASRFWDQIILEPRCGGTALKLPRSPTRRNESMMLDLVEFRFCGGKQIINCIEILRGENTCVIAPGPLDASDLAYFVSMDGANHNSDVAGHSLYVEVRWQAKTQFKYWITYQQVTNRLQLKRANN